MAEIAAIAGAIGTAAGEAALAAAPIAEAASAAAPYVALAGAGAGAYGTYQSGVAAKERAAAESAAVQAAAAIEARSLKRRAADEMAEAVQRARRERREKEYVESRQRAVAAGSGSPGGATVLDIIGDTVAEGEYLAAAQLYGGETAAAGLRGKAKFAKWQAGTQAKSLREAGAAAYKGSVLDATTEAAGSFKKLYG